MQAHDAVDLLAVDHHAQGLGALGDEVIPLLLDLCEGERVLACGLSRRGLALEDVDDQGGLVLGRPALRAFSIGIEFSREGVKRATKK